MPAPRNERAHQMDIAGEGLLRSDTEATMDNSETQVRTELPLEPFEAAAVAACGPGTPLTISRPGFSSAIDTVAEWPEIHRAARRF